MKSQPAPQIRKALLTSLLALGAFSPAVLYAALTLDSSEHWVPATTPGSNWGDLEIKGNFSAWQGLDLGVTAGANPTSALQLDFNSTTKIASFDLTDSAAGFIWRDSIASSAKSKMSLDSSNTLKLYKADGTTVGLTLNPNTGITLADGTQLNGAASLRSTALYDASGNVVASVASDGKVMFINGITFGANPNVKLNASNVAALQSTLNNLGYQENPVTATPIKKINLAGNLGVTSAVAVGSNLYVGGYFKGTATIGTSSIVSAGLYDSFVAKLDASGGTLWAISIGGLLDDYATSVSVDSSGNVFVVGNFNGVTTNLYDYNITSAGSTDAYVAKLNSSGTVQWAKPLGGTLSDAASSVSVDSGGNVLVVGNFVGTTTNLATNISSAGSTDGYVAKWNSAGVEQWAKPIGGSLYDYATSVTVDGNDNVLVAGAFDGATTNLVGTPNILSAGYSDGYVAKFTPTGTAQWAKPIGGASYDGATSVGVDNGGNILVGGNFNGTTTNLAVNIPSAGSGDGFVAAWNSNGMGQWARPIGGPSYDSVSSVRVESSGNVLVAGNFAGTTTNLATNITSVGLQDGFLVRLAANGNPLNSQVLGGSGDDSVYDVIAWGSDFYVRGSAGTGGTFALGNTRIAPGPYLVGLSSFNIVSPAVLPSVPLAWGGSAALGLGSTALGGSAFAEGKDSVALGAGQSLGDSSLSFGTGRALGMNSIALGSGIATGLNSIALGAGNAYGPNSFAVGLGEASGWNSFALGAGSKASGRSSLAGGSFANTPSMAVQVSGSSSIAWGTGLTVAGHYSQSFGSWNSVPANNATAIGTRLTAQSHNSFALGRYNIIQGDPSNWVPTDDLFVVGNGDTATSPSNAVKTLKNGQTTLTNKAWKADPAVSPTPENSSGNALVVDGNTVLNGKATLNGGAVITGQVTIATPQGDISMGNYGN